MSTFIIAKQVSKPMKSANVRGPMGTLVPNFIVLSISSAVPIPSYKAKTASFMYGIKILFAMKPGTSLAVEQVLPMDSASCKVVANVFSSVYKAVITSTNFMTGTGFIKCMPITWCARSGTIPPILEIEIDEVLLAIIAWSGTVLARPWKMRRLISKSSFAASMTKSTSLRL